MKAFILAAGLGTRLKPLTDKVPKPMLPIGGKPLLEYQIDLLKKHGVTEIAMNLYHLPEAIKKYFGDGTQFGVDIKYIKEKTLSGTAGPINNLKEFFDEPFFVLYGDNLTDINLTDLKKFHQMKGGMVSVALYQEKHPESKGIVRLDNNSKILEFKEKPKKEEVFSNLANAGIYLCEPDIVEYICEGFCDFGKDLFPLLIKNNFPIFGYKADFYLLDIGTPETFKQAQKDILNTFQI